MTGPDLSLAYIERLEERIAELERVRDRLAAALRGLLAGVHGDGYVLPAGAVATERARAALAGLGPCPACDGSGWIESSSDAWRCPCNPAPGLEGDK